MLTLSEVDEVASRLARPHVKGRLQEVISAPTLDSVGEPALSITFVVDGEVDFTQLLTAIDQGLRKVGEDRFPILRFATPADMERRARARS